MSEQNVVMDKAKGLYKTLCQTEWNATVTGLDELALGWPERPDDVVVEPPDDCVDRLLDEGER